jgi:hypothetical protein
VSPPIILYHGQYSEHWEWRLNRLDEVDVVIPVWNEDPSNLLVKAMAKTCLGTNSMVILHFPDSESDVEIDGNCVTVSTDQQLMDVTRSILENKKYDYGTKIYYGTKIEFDYGAQIDGETGIETEGDDDTDSEMDISTME